LNTILKKHHPQLDHIDAMIVDTEGWEREVLMGLDLGKYNPKVICLENFKKLSEYRSFMTDKGYKLDKEIEQDEFYSQI
jgi:Methyltransferase FkbM domain